MEAVEVAAPAPAAKPAPVLSKKCQHCDRRFSKVEHLRRHQRSRTWTSVAMLFPQLSVDHGQSILTSSPTPQTRARSRSSATSAVVAMQEGTRFCVKFYTVVSMPTPDLAAVMSSIAMSKATIPPVQRPTRRATGPGNRRI